MSDRTTTPASRPVPPPAEDGEKDGEMDGLEVFVDDDGSRFAVHEYGYLIGLDDVPDDPDEGS